MRNNGKIKRVLLKIEGYPYPADFTTNHDPGSPTNYCIVGAKADNYSLSTANRLGQQAYVRTRQH
jgi:hypothetical protein